MTRSRYQTGLVAESLCRIWLRCKGYRILAARYKTPMGEIDIVAARGKVVVAVEVKARPRVDDALRSISAQQRGRIERALQDFVMRHPRLARCDLRFDVMLATPKRWPVHIVNAWHAD